MKTSYLTILVLGGLFSAIAIGLSIASFSRYKRVSPTKEIQNENKDKVKSTPSLGRDLVKTARAEDSTEAKATTTTTVGFEDRKVRRVKKYKSNGRAIYE